MHCGDKQRKKNPHRSQRGISPLCLRGFASVQARAHVLLPFIVMGIYHNKQLNNATLQNKGTSLCMLKNKWPHK